MRETLDQSENNHNFPVADEGRSSREKQLSDIGLTVISTVLENDREISEIDLKSRLKEQGIRTDRVISCLRNTLCKNGLVARDDGLLAATAKGLEVTAQNTHRLDSVFEEAAKEKIVRFGEMKYKLFEFLDNNVSDSDWLFDGLYRGSATEHVSREIGTKPDLLTRRMHDYRQAGLIKTLISKGGVGEGSPTTDIGITEKGREQLRIMREKYPDKIAEMRENELEGPDLDDIPEDVLRDTATKMSEEVNNMHWELGEGPEDFGHLEGLNEEELRMLVKKFEKQMNSLMQRIDSGESADSEQQLLAA